MSDAPSRARQRAASSWAALPGGIVDGGEIVLLAIKPSLWRPVFESAAWLVMSVLLAGALTWLGRPLPGLSQTLTAQVILLAGVIRLGIATVRWAPMWYVLTNRRVLDVCGVRSPRIWACPVIDIRNTYLNASPSEKLTRLGTLTFVTEHPDEPPRTWSSVPQPELVHDRIRRAIEQAIDQQGIS